MSRPACSWIGAWSGLQLHRKAANVHPCLERLSNSCPSDRAASAIGVTGVSMTIYSKVLEKLTVRHLVKTYPRIIWNPKDNCRVYISPLPVPIISQINPVHLLPSHLFKIHFNIIHLAFLSGHFLQVSPPKSCKHYFSRHAYVHHSPPITWKIFQ